MPPLSLGLSKDQGLLPRYCPLYPFNKHSFSFYSVQVKHDEALLSQSHAIGETDKHLCTKSDENRPGQSCGLGLRKGSSVGWVRVRCVSVRRDSCLEKVASDMTPSAGEEVLGRKVYMQSGPGAERT